MVRTPTHKGTQLNTGELNQKRITMIRAVVLGCLLYKTAVSNPYRDSQTLSAHMFSSSLRQLALEWFQFEPPGPQCDDMESPQPAGATDEKCI